ncbi:TetR/AcrR family transcriptional regulator [Pseudomonas sp. LRF_L74]|uniref:TetR/AcrR family transcriptional regulator n=1 Tax=Pseudomonas sp. LRF_L74 TaxID=3369422 RepID=UPI003F6491E3
MTADSLSPAAERIALLALDQFAEHGYDAASLNDIAVLAGIRKASLYAHFDGKDALYQVTLELALQAERAYVAEHFAGSGNAGFAGEPYLDGLSERFRGNSSLRFLLRAAFYPPEPLRQVVIDGFERYLGELRARFLDALNVSHPPPSTSVGELLAETYMAAIDSLHVDLTYGNAEAYERRLSALRRIIPAIDLDALRP